MVNSLLNEGDNGIVDVSNLRVYGCRAYVTIAPEDRVRSEKMAPRAQIGKLIGYEGKSLYLILLPPGSVSRQGGGIVKTSHVTFDESIIDD